MTYRIRHGDNLTIMREMEDETIDLIYADPPFCTQRDFGEFDDRWEDGLDGYIAFMRPRLTAMRLLLKPTGSLYLHCDPTASHYLKLMLDAIFGRANYRNEIVWGYAGGGVPKKDYPRKHDTILRYTKSKDWVFSVERKPYGEHGIHGRRATDRGGTRSIELNPNGTPVNDWWDDIKPLINWSQERTGYPTQKPLALLERIIKASSNAGDVVLDPFCGSGTSGVAAVGLGRSWIGVDSSAVAVETTQQRLKTVAVVE